MQDWLWGVIVVVVIATWLFYAVRALEADSTWIILLGTWFSKRDPVRLIAYLFLALGIMIALWGNQYSGPGQSLVSDFYANGATEFVSIAITVLVIDRFNQYRLSQQEKRRLVLQLGSSDLGFATEASRLLNLNGWLRDGSVRGAYLHGTNLSRAVLTHADFKDCEMSQVKLKFAWLDHAIFENTKLTGSDMSDAHLVEANFRGAQMGNVDLSRAILAGADLSGANLTSANLRSANLMCAVLTDANLADADLLEAIYDENTVWPDGFDYERTEALLIAQ